MNGTQKLSQILAASVAVLALISVMNVAGNTLAPVSLPSTGISRDTQYFPPGPEFKLTKQIQAMEEYKLRQQAGEVEE